MHRALACLTEQQIAEMAAGAVRHHDRLVARYGADSHQTRAARRAVEAIERGMRGDR